MRITCVSTIPFLWWACSAALAGPSADQLVQASGVRGGLVVHLGCADGQLTCGLRTGPAYLVVGLDDDAKSVQRARQRILADGLYGPVSVDRFDGGHLPLVDNVANLIVVTADEGPVLVDELARVLAPRGVVLAPAAAVGQRSGGLERQPAEGLDGWVKLVKPVPPEIDQWSHFLHAADNNAVAADGVVGPPRHLQWMADPLWMRYHHTLASLSALVTAGGRIFYVLDESPAASIAVPPEWVLCARDAFSGVLLWKKPIAAWASHTIKFRSGPVDLPRRLVASDELVFATLARGGPVSVLDAATGKTLRVLEGTDRTEEILVDGDVVLAVRGGEAAAAQEAAKERRRGGDGAKKQPRKKRGGAPSRATGGDILAFDAQTGRKLWEKRQPPGSVLPLTLAASGRRVFFQGSAQLVCLSQKDGNELWRADRTAKLGASYFAPTVVVADDVVLSADGSALEAFDATGGGRLWGCPARASFHSSVEVFVIDGVVWLGPAFAEGRDLKTGEITKQNPAAGLLATVGHHHRCYRNKATTRYIIDGYRGMEFYDLQGQNDSRNNWVRGTCQYGVMPANGLCYAPPHACGCYPEAKLFGFYALSGELKAKGAESRADENRIERGSAFGSLGPRPASRDSRPSADWPTYRHDPMRSGSTAAGLSGQLAPAWKAEVGGKLSAPTVADGRLLVSSIDQHTVVCLDAKTGRKQWSYTAGGRVDSPPTLYGGLALLGAADGCVYCLRAEDGQLAWRRRVAPTDRRTVARDRLESVWPVHGSILVLDDTAYAAAGRSSWLDGGIRLVGLDPRTGQVRCQTTVASRHPDLQETLRKKDTVREVPTKPAQNGADWKTVAAPDLSDAFSMGGGTLNDVLVSDGQSVYMKQVRFDRNLQRQSQKGRHLYSTSSLLDGNENHRSHWMLGTFEMTSLPVAYSWIANRRGGRSGVAFTVPYGLMLSFDPNSAWCVWRGYGSGPSTLFARPNRPFSQDDAPMPDFGSPAERGVPPAWSVELPTRPRAMARAGQQILLAGRPASDTIAAYRAAEGGVLVAVSAADGTVSLQRQLDAPPVWDGMAVAGGRLYLALEDGTVRCLGR